MRLFVGGYGQGQEELVLDIYRNRTCQVYRGDKIKDLFTDRKKEADEVLILTDFHLFIKEQVESKNQENSLSIPDFVEEILAEIRKAEEAFAEVILVANEVGNGIVPLTKEERFYRDALGSVEIALAKEAEGVTRVICGIPQKLK